MSNSRIKVSALGLGCVLLLGGIFFFVQVRQMRPESAPLERLFPVPKFSLTNCNGQQVSNQDLSGTVWVVDFIFTRCAGPCPLMTQRMRLVQTALHEAGLLQPAAPVAVASISVDPAYDQPEILRRYADTWHADLSSWYFLTGEKTTTLQLIREGFKITADTPANSLADDTLPTIIHSTNFLLVDQAGWVRRIHHFEDADMVGAIVRDVRTLLGPE